MSVTINGSPLKKLPYNGYDVKEWFHNGIKVWQLIDTGYVSFNGDVVSTSRSYNLMPGSVTASKDIVKVLSVSSGYQMVTILEDISSLSVYCSGSHYALDRAINAGVYVFRNESNAGTIYNRTVSFQNQQGGANTIVLKNLKKGETVSIRRMGGTSSSDRAWIYAASTFTWNA